MKGLILRAAREPMVQFLLAALLLFALDGLLNPMPARPSGNQVTISRGQVDQIAESFRLVSGRPPSREELRALVKDYADEEIFYREAVAMGLDIDDVIVRRRMRQKLEFLSEEQGAPEPTDAQLRARLKDHPADYRLPPRVAFEQILASGDVRGASAKGDAAVFARRLNRGTDPASLGDGSMLPASSPLASRDDVAARFGDEFADTIFGHSGEGWFAPVMSPLGAHAVRITAKEAARYPTLDEVRGRLRSDWIEARRQDERERLASQLRKRYRVQIDWPEDDAGR